MSSLRALSRALQMRRSFSGAPKQADEAAAAARQAAEQAKAAIAEKAAAAQRLAQDTVKELFGRRSSESSDQQQQQQQEQQGSAQEAASAAGPGGSDEKSRPNREAPTKPGLLDRVRSTATVVIKEMVAAVSAETPSTSAMRGAPKGGSLKTAETTALAHHSVAEPAWQKQWRELQNKLGSHPLFSRLSSHLDQQVLTRGRDVAGSLRERWETSDSPLVHRLQDAADSWSQESEGAAALREIRARDPDFDMVRFLARVRADVPVIIGAYLRGEADVIREHCSPEMVERLTGIMAATAQSGQVPDPTLLDTSDVELVDLKLSEEAPCVVVQFTCQQINCARDSHGNVVDGAPDDVHRVYYFWALQQEAEGYMGTDGTYQPPRWQLREMMIRGMHHLL
ncbi:TIM44 [Auxenochlorella protothecoides x Auxenochlorella symbiontica]